MSWDHVLSEHAARAPFSIVEADAGVSEILRAIPAEMIVVDVKHLFEMGIASEQDLLHEIAELLGVSVVDRTRLVEQLAEALIGSSKRLVLLRVPNELLSGLLRRLCGIGRQIVEKSQAEWDKPTVLTLALSPTQCAQSWLSSDESNVLDFCDPGQIVFADSRPPLPLVVSSLAEGAGALFARLPEMDAQQLERLRAWPQFSPAIDTELVEGAPRRILCGFIASAATPALQVQRIRIARLVGAIPTDLTTRSAGRPAVVRCLSKLLLPPIVRNADVGASEKISSMANFVSFDDLFAESAVTLAPMIGWLGSTKPLSTDIFSGPAVFRVKNDEPALIGRLNLAAALEVLYRIRTAAAHGLPRSTQAWAIVADAIATYVSAAALILLKGVWPEVVTLDPALVKLGDPVPAAKTPGTKSSGRSGKR
jgi:hypothetical protein